MNDRELIERLKEARVPDRPEEYWEAFPWRVRMNLVPPPPTPSRWRLAPANLGRRWAAELVLAVAMVFVGVHFGVWREASAAMAKHERVFHSQMARLHTGLQRLILNTDGMGYLLAEPN
jgi:hypothetical protein